jgi:thiol-disulfide isomerase/thioredoxin
MVYADQPDSTHAPPTGDWLPRRRTVIVGLIGTLASLATKAAAAPQELAVPAFRSGQYQFTILRPQRELPSVKLFRLDGKTTDLSLLRGKPILLNFWATWCAACRTELPILDRLHEDHRRAGLHVIAVSVDRGKREVVERFLQTMKLRSLPIYWDPNGGVAYSDRDNTRNSPFALYGMPMTYLIASSGRIVGYMPGAADWTSEAASRLIEYLRHS